MFTQNKRYKVSWVDYVNVDKNRSKLNKSKNAQNPGNWGGANAWLWVALSSLLLTPNGLTMVRPCPLRQGSSPLSHSHRRRRQMRYTFHPLHPLLGRAWTLPACGIRRRAPAYTNAALFPFLYSFFGGERKKEKRKKCFSLPVGDCPLALCVFVFSSCR